LCNAANKPTDAGRNIIFLPEVIIITYLLLCSASDVGNIVHKTATTVNSTSADTGLEISTVATTSISEVTLVADSSHHVPTSGIVVEIVLAGGQSTVQHFSPGEDVIFSVNNLEQDLSLVRV